MGAAGDGWLLGGLGLLVLALAAGAALALRRAGVVRRGEHRQQAPFEATVPGGSVYPDDPLLRSTLASDWVSSGAGLSTWPGQSSTPAVSPSRGQLARPAHDAKTTQVQAEVAAHAHRLAAARAARQRARDARETVQALARAPLPAAAGRAAPSNVPTETRRVATPAPRAPSDQFKDAPTHSAGIAAGLQQGLAEPRAKVDGGRVGGPAPRLPRSAPASASRSDPAAPAAALPQPPLVLIVDDSKLARVKLSRLLRPLGWRVIEATDGQAAQQAYADERPDLVITDVDMPEVDGFGLTRAIRAMAPAMDDLRGGGQRRAEVPVIMITGADERHRIEAACAGVTLLLGKPYGEEALLAHLRRLLPRLAPWLGMAQLPVASTNVRTGIGEANPQAAVVGD